MNRYRLAAVDLDGTLLGPDKRIHADNARAIRALQACGVEVVLASGRRYDNMLSFQEQLGLVGPMVACQGADVRDGDFCAQDFVTPGAVLEVLRFGRQVGATLIVYSLESTQVEQRDGLVELYESRALTRVELRSDLTGAGGTGVFKVILSLPAEQVPGLAERVRQLFGSRLKTVITNAETLEVMAPGIDKATGMAILAERRGVGRDQILAFGDGDNDVELLQWAGLGFAMSDSTTAAVAAASRQAPEGDAATSLARAVASLEEQIICKTRR